VAPERANPPGLRGRLARAGAPVVRVLARLPRWLVIAVFVLLIVGGLFASRWPATACLAVVALLLGWLAAVLGATGGTGRTVARVAAFGLLVVLAVVRASGAGLGV